MMPGLGTRDSGLGTASGGESLLRRAAAESRVPSPESRLLALVLLLLTLASPLPAQTRALDDFETLSGWTAHPSDGVALAIRQDDGHRGRAMRLDFDFKGGGGYAIARKVIGVDLPENYAFTFWVRGEAQPNNLEFKLLADTAGETVWWSNKRDFEFPAQWTKVTIKRRHVEFAWGPTGGKEGLKHVAAIELSITAGRGGKGSVWIDELALTPLEPVRPYDLTPRATASSSAPGSDPARLVDDDSTTGWRSDARGGLQWLALDFLRNREYGGLVVDWSPNAFAADYVVEVSADGVHWEPAYTVRGGNGGRDYIYLPETESRHLRLRLLASGGGRGYGIRAIDVKPIGWATTLNELYLHVAHDAPRGTYPKYFADSVQDYWTVIGVSGNQHEGLINEEGVIESDKGSFSVEPFLFTGGRLITWADARQRQSLERGYLPIPSVEWTRGNLALTVTAVAVGEPGASSIYARYRVANRGARPTRATLFLALRPFQVNPPWQFLNTPGGSARTREIAWDGSTVRVDKSRHVVPVTTPAGFGATTFDQGEIVDFLRRGTLPEHKRAVDSLGRASAALAYPLEIPAGGARDVYLALPFPSDTSRSAQTAERDGTSRTVPSRDRATPDSARAVRAFVEAARTWRSELDRVFIELPPAAMPVVRTLKTTLAYILINRDGPAIQPGSRSYERSWIRDGSLTSAALLRLGHAREVRKFIEWFAPHQYPNGKVPCCVDYRGADPVPENDSHGQLIYLIAEYYRFTKDRPLLERMWPHIEKAVGYMDSLRHERMTPEYRTPEKRAFYGLLPQSISHEGYSAKPMHSYWDDFFALKGLKDATDMAAVLGKKDEQARFATIRDEFQRDLQASIRLAMQKHDIDYIPGSVELGDFDATSTTVGVTPAGEMERLSPGALRRTFERYYEKAHARAEGNWGKEDAYTPYEWRTVGTFVRLGWKDRAHELVDFFFRDRRPAAWNQWAEVVWRDPKTPKFIGDMPHTWVGSDFIRSTLDMFAYERESDSTLVVGAGIPAEWVSSEPGVAIHNLHTEYGTLGFTMKKEGSAVRVRLEGDARVPPGGIVLRSPLARPLESVTVNGAPAERFRADEVTLNRLPAEVILRY